jgi:type II secretory pathway pseudopilin PulG
METRLIVAYSLIAILAALAIFGGVMLTKKRAKSRQRDEGRRSHL